MIDVLARHEVEVRSEEDVIVARRRVQSAAQARGFDPFATAAITTATSELARNMFRHAGGGVMVLEEVARAERVGLRLQFRDEGPGIADVARVLHGGYSTAGSLGLGISGSRRLVDEFVIAQNHPQGTQVTILKWKRF